MVHTLDCIIKLFGALWVKAAPLRMCRMPRAAGFHGWCNSNCVNCMDGMKLMWVGQVVEKSLQMSNLEHVMWLWKLAARRAGANKWNHTTSIKHHAKTTQGSARQYLVYFGWEPGPKPRWRTLPSTECSTLFRDFPLMGMILVCSCGQHLDLLNPSDSVEQLS